MAKFITQKIAIVFVPFFGVKFQKKKAIILILRAAVCHTRLAACVAPRQSRRPAAPSTINSQHATCRAPSPHRPPQPCAPAYALAMPGGVTASMRGPIRAALQHDHARLGHRRHAPPSAAPFRTRDTLRIASHHPGHCGQSQPPRDTPPAGAAGCSRRVPRVSAANFFL